jgi:hypothetical protein
MRVPRENAWKACRRVGYYIRRAILESGPFQEAGDFPVHFGAFTGEVAGAVLTLVVHGCYPLVSPMSGLAASLPLKVALCFPRRLSVFIPIIPDSFSGALYNQCLGKNL